ncbi:MAG: SDR family NAD(P)-dependent oxidoreductase [Chloroflexi bacterium]|nr:SDR family NAD(P)-dependent oxidoreductase [Chloroflexota bacterium]
MRELNGKVAVITGGASGMGRAFARRFAREGMRMVVADVAADALEQLTRELKSAGHDAIGVLTDVSRAEAVEHLARVTLDTYGGVHLLCNNAGVSGGRGHARFHVYADPPAIWEATLNDWQWITGVNYWGVAHGIRVFVPIMLQQNEDGHIVNTASISGLVPGGNVYGATKHAVVSMSESLRMDLQRRGAWGRLGVTCLCPTLINTDIYTGWRHRPEALRDEEPAPSEAELERLRGVYATGLPPEHVADLLLEAVLQNEFYVIPNHSVDTRIRERMEEILNRRDLHVSQSTSAE